VRRGLRGTPSPLVFLFLVNGWFFFGGNFFRGGFFSREKIFGGFFLTAPCRFFFEKFSEKNFLFFCFVFFSWRFFFLGAFFLLENSLAFFRSAFVFFWLV